jgi:hypothetical protein
MQCKYLLKRKNKPYCSHDKKNQFIEFKDCSNCKEKDYKEVKIYKLKQNKPIKQRTYKQVKAEKNRFSVFTDDLTKSIESKLPKNDLHECIGGKNRHNSIKYGLVVPLTRNEHDDPQIKLKWLFKAQDWFINEYGYDKFMEVFKMNYIEAYKNKLLKLTNSDIIKEKR